MSNELDDVARALFNGQIPQIWRALAPDTLKNLANWMAHFRQRNDQYVSWVNDGEPNCTWLSGVGSNRDHFIFYENYLNKIKTKVLPILKTRIQAFIFPNHI